MRLVLLRSGLVAGGLLVSTWGFGRGKTCAFLNSYHPGYEWGEKLESSLKQAIGTACEIRYYYLDAKNHPDAESGKAKGIEIKKQLDEWKPDLIIACDDPASAFVIKPFYKDSATPVVFCGINWSGDEYGYPYKNATGMVEVFPVKPLAEIVKEVVPTAKEGTYLGADTITDRKTGEHVAKLYQSYGLKLDVVYAPTQTDWEKKFKEAQSKDFVLVTSVSGLKDANLLAAAEFVKANAKKFTIGFLDFALPLYMFAMTEIAEEQGEYVGQVAVKILQGAKPSDFPIIPNSRWRMYVQPELLKKAKIELPARYLHKAEKIKGVTKP